MVVGRWKVGGLVVVFVLVLVREWLWFGREGRMALYLNDPALQACNTMVTEAAPPFSSEEAAYLSESKAVWSDSVGYRESSCVNLEA